MDGFKKLDDSSLFAVNGGSGATDAEVQTLKEQMDRFFGFVPQDIRDKILRAYALSGKDAARKLAEKLTKAYPHFQLITDLFSE